MMDLISKPRSDDRSHDPLRRSLLVTFVFGYTAFMMPRAFSATDDKAAYGDFVAVSQFLTGHPSLDEAQAVRLFNAMSEDDFGFAEKVQSLRALIDSRHPDPMQLQGVLEFEKSALSRLPRMITHAWYLGVVGEGKRARCLAFEDNLTNIAVKDKLAPPSYCFGAYGSWAAKPI